MGEVFQVKRKIIIFLLSLIHAPTKIYRPARSTAAAVSFRPGKVGEITTSSSWKITKSSARSVKVPTRNQALEGAIASARLRSTTAPRLEVGATGKSPDRTGD
jgi:hypothetical protein